MKNVLVILTKNLVLVSMVIAYMLFAFTNYIGYKESKYVFIIFGLLYFISAIAETIILSKQSADVIKYGYITDAFLTKRFIKIIALICCGTVLLLSASIVQSLSYLCYTIAITEIIITLWRWIGKLNYVTIEDNSITISTNKKIIVYVDEIEKIEIRHGITYLIKKNKDSESIRTDSSMKHNRSFLNTLKEFAIRHELKFIENE
jgi:hypothetical protein